MSGERAIEATVRGIVQGVGFRYSTRRAAERLGVSGWVRNAADGSVEVMAQGSRPAVNAMIEFLEMGPVHAHVSSVEVSEVANVEGQTSFRIDA